MHQKLFVYFNIVITYKVRYHCSSATLRPSEMVRATFEGTTIYSLHSDVESVYALFMTTFSALARLSLSIIKIAGDLPLLPILWGCIL